jgi:hypothetical protein
MSGLAFEDTGELVGSDVGKRFLFKAPAPAEPQLAGSKSETVAWLSVLLVRPSSMICA